jgi:hypothetical protein
MAIWSILALYFVALWNILRIFGVLFPVLVCCTKENLASLELTRTNRYGHLTKRVGQVAFGRNPPIPFRRFFANESLLKALHRMAARDLKSADVIAQKALKASAR